MATPEHLPTGFWDQPAVAEALATCDIGALLRLVQAERRWSQADLADVLGYSQTWVSRVLKGRALTVDQIRDICRRVGVPLDRLRLGFREDDATNRRQFGKSAATAAALAVLPGAHAPRPVDADDATVATLTAVTGLQRRLEATTPARELVPGAVAHLGVARHALTRTGAKLLGVIAEAAGFAAWLHADMADAGTARSYYKIGIDAARRAEHGLMTAYMTGSLAQFELDDDPRLALLLLGRVRAAIDTQPPPTAAAWLACLEALAHASARDSHSCRTALADAEHAVAASERTAAPPWPWVFPFTAEKLAGYRALCAVRLAHPAEALDAFTQSSSATQPAEKQHAVLMLEIATIKRMDAEFDEAFALAEAALAMGVRHRSERVIQAARRFRASYTGPHLPAVTAFDDRLLAATIG
ncbi:helix-turn-helix transcriptional regulator [Nonomuraea endophytica]|uniref:helix-turn-helix transcriptional regulator n=1 Tax=Nonomuraea endophytica TaxID=714136 RepID=UPI0037CA06B1